MTHDHFQDHRFQHSAGGCALWLCMLLFWMLPIAAAADCGLIRDADQRHFCQAKANASTAQCGLIKDSDLRHHCRAIVQQSPADCELIRNADQR